MIASVVSALPAGGATPTLTLAGRRHRDSIAALLATRLGAPKPNPALTRAVNTALVLLADHELATSTFAARLAASTRADVYSAVAAGAACGGPLHVGASRDVTRLFRRAEEIGPRRAVTEELSAGRHLAGFGHKIYAKDPRHDPFFELVRTAGFSGRRLTLVEEVLAPGCATTRPKRSSSSPGWPAGLPTLARSSRNPPCDSGPAVSTSGFRLAVRHATTAGRSTD
jgi:hypothetical protein